MKTRQMFVAALCSNAVMKKLTFGLAICTIGIMSANADWPTALDAGSTHAFILKADGTVWAWGVNTYGQLGDGTTTTRSSPVQVSGLTGVVAVAGEYESSLALKSDGTVWAWGRNQYGQLGDGTATTRTTPVQVSGLSGVIAISGGTDHSLALKSDGTVWAWGNNTYGELGDGTTTSRSTPVQVSGLSGVAAIDCGGPNSYALKSDGTVWAWGRNEYGALGDGTSSQRTTPVQTSGLTNVIAISGGGASALALKSDGTVWAWGFNGYGQLGDGTTTSRSTPVQVSGLSGMVALAAAIYHSVALKSDGTVWAWGFNQFGEVGDGTTTQRNTPVQVSGLTGIVSINAPTGEASSHALKSDGTVWGWGHNNSYQLGDGTTTSRSTPVQVSGLSGVGHQFHRSPLDAGSTHAFILKADGTVWAWGVNTYGQLGDGTTTTRSAPVQVSGLTGVVAVAGEYESSLALKSDGTVWAWGRNSYGQLGDGTATTRTTPVQVSGLSGVIAISGGTDHSLALKSDGTVWAWGNNTYGELGDGTTTSRSTPVQVSGLTGVAAIDCGGPNSYALKSDGKVWAWGRNEYGALGDGTSSQRTTPVQTSGLTNVIAISGGGASAMALKSDGTVWAWGFNGYGQLGDGTTTSRSTPVQVSGLSGMVALAPAIYHSVALKSDGTVWAWGYNQFGEVGDGTTAQRNTPVQVSGLTGIVSINAPTGEASSHALKSDGTVWGWGHNNSYQLGDGTTTNRSTPVQVSWLTDSAPSAPGGISASDGTYTDRIRVTWNPVSSASGYQLFRNSSDSSNGLAVYATTTDTTYDDTAVSVGVNYYYWVKATNSAGASAFSASDAGYVGALNAPAGVSASDGTYTDRVRVTWNTVTAAGGYQLFRNTSDSSNGLSAYATTTDTTYDDTAALAGTIYYYWVKATNAVGASAFSASDSGYRVAPGAPSAPTNVLASDGAYTDKVRVSWATVSDATSYEVWRNTSNDWASAVKIVDTFAFTVLGLAEGVAGLQGAAGGMTYDDTAAVAGTVYYYWVKAKNSSGTSGFSTADSGYVAVAGSLVPPDNVVASDGTYTNKVRIMWSAVDGATAYEVWRGNINVSAFASLLAETAGTLADDTDAIAETTYYYWVKAKNATETSAFSSSDSGFRSNVSSIQPDVKINETDGQITMVRGEDLRVAILLMTSSGIDADWWFIAATPGGWYYYDASAGTWLTFTDLATLHPSYQGPLFDFLAPVEIISVNTSWLVPGVYVIYFGVDTTMNGILDDTLYYDSSTLNLVE